MASNLAKHGFIYIWYDSWRKMYYIGSHWGREDDGYICSSNWMATTQKRRPETFKRRILETNIPDRQTMLDREYYWLSMIKESEIKPKNSTPRYYNLKIVRDNHWHHLENERKKSIGQKISAAKKGKKIGCTPERAKAISEGKKKAFAEGKTVYSDEWRAKNSASKTGSKHSLETRKKMSESAKGRTPWNKGLKSTNP